MDAISFVLGIKSSRLRSSHLRDLVYRGRVLRTSTIGNDGLPTVTDTLDPASQPAQEPSEQNDPKVAWVMAVYEDDSGEEQEWKRSITSQGVSEYRINNRVVSATQYNDALEAEHILIKARNFLVFQGDVESIASQSPKDLTRLIEQISGSLEYKADYDRLKIEQEEALENQNFQLNRRRGINSEVKQYQDQKREVQNYTRKAEERDQAIITHILWKLFHFQRLIEESSAEIQKNQDELKEFRRSIEKYERNLEQAKRDHAIVGRDMTRVEKSIKNKEKAAGDTERSLVPIDEKIDVSHQKIQRCSVRIKEIVRESDGQSKAIRQLEKDFSVVEKAQSQWETEWEKTTSKKGIRLSDADLQEYSKLKEEVNKRSSEAQLKLANLRRQYKTDSETVNSLKTNYESHEWQYNSLISEAENMKERKETLTNTTETTKNEIDQKKRTLSALASERLKISQGRTEVEEKLQVTIKSILEVDDGRKQSEKEIRMRELISTLKRIFPGVKGRVSDLCRPKQKKYTDAVSTVLGRHFDAIVVDNEKTAKECIQHLRDQRAGQGTFIPLDTIQVKAFNSNLKGMHRAMRPAVETVDYDDSVSRAITYACGNAIVCDDLATAKYLCYERGVDAKAVTLDGTVIHKGGLMTGGRGPNNQQSRRWEETNVANLYKIKDNLIHELESMPKTHRKGLEEENLQGQLTGLEQKLSFARDELAALERNINSKKTEIEHVDHQLLDVKPRYEEKARALESLEESVDEVQNSVSSVENEVYREFCRRLGFNDIGEYEAQQGSLQQEAAAKKLEFTTQISRIQNQLTFEKQRLQVTNDRVSSLRAQEQRDQNMISELKTERGTILERLDTINAELELLKEELQQQQARYDQSTEHLNAQRAQVQKHTKNAESMLKAVSSLEGEVQRYSLGRYALLRRCKLENIDLPLERGSRPLDNLPIDDLLQTDPDAMEIDEDPNLGNVEAPAIQDYGIQVDFDTLGDSLKEACIIKSSVCVLLMLSHSPQKKKSTMNCRIEFAR